MFWVGRRTVGRGPGGSSRHSSALKTTTGSLSAAADEADPIQSLGDVAAATKRSTTSHLTLCGAQLGTSGRFPHPSNYFRWISSTSGRRPAPHTEPRSTPAHEVQRFRHSAIVLAHLPGISHFPSPKWRLKLLPVPVLTRNFDFRTQLPTKKWICSRLSPSLTWFYS